LYINESAQKIVAVNAGPRMGWNTETLQLRDYSKTDWPWTMFDPAARKERHETVFPLDRQKAFDMGAALAEE
jgi:hypothetical protein